MNLHDVLVSAGLGIALVGLAACAVSSDEASGSLGDPIDEDMPPGSHCGTGTGNEVDTDCGSSGATDPSTTGVDPTCQSSAECDGGVCAAAYDTDTERPGMFACQFTCIDTLDDAQWCLDDGSCCDAEATCSERGYCVVDGVGTTTASTTDGSTGDGSTGDGTGGTTGGSR